jgi:hypothetical protein
MTPVSAVRLPREKPTKPRTAPPAACTTAAQVRDRALAPVMDCHALQQYQADEFETIRGLTHDPLVRDALDRLDILAVDHRRKMEDTAEFLDLCAASLERAEAERDWDGLTSQELSGRQIAEGLNSCLDPLISDADDREARRALRSWFERYERDEFRAGRIAYHVGIRRQPILDREYAQWLELASLTGDTA